jgi:hypothetical protein
VSRLDRSGARHSHMRREARRLARRGGTGATLFRTRCAMPGGTESRTELSLLEPCSSCCVSRKRGEARTRVSPSRSYWHLAPSAHRRPHAAESQQFRRLHSTPTDGFCNIPLSALCSAPVAVTQCQGLG